MTDSQAEDITGSIWLPKYHTLRDSLKQFSMGKFPAWSERAHVDRVGEETSSSNKDKNTVRGRHVSVAKIPVATFDVSRDLSLLARVETFRSNLQLSELFFLKWPLT